MAVEVSDLSRAVDEIYALRRLLAYEIERVEADLEMKSYPKSRRDSAQKTIDRLREAVKGRYQETLRAIHSERPVTVDPIRSAMLRQGGDLLLTNSRWLKESEERGY